ncbi:MAG: translation elongation factor Ts [Puniceicoccales bacterium]|jgi:elongation factor Ts|nr:translation elongation factor Ts [Puniceicoccales bacterium]
MANITAQQVNNLRARTGVGLMDCKKALVETNGDEDAAIELLRKKGAATQIKRADKESNEGIVAVHLSDDGKTAAIAEVNTETDFVAKTDNFKAFAATVVRRVFDSGENSTASLAEELSTIVAQTGENVKISRSARFIRDGYGILASYVHNGGKIGVLVEFATSAEPPPALAAFSRQVAMHIAAAAPRYLTRDDVPADIIAKEREIAIALSVGKPEAAVNKLVLGKIEKYFGETCLLDQKFVIDNSGKTISELLAGQATQAGQTVSITRFKRFQVGVPPE